MNAPSSGSSGQAWSVEIADAHYWQRNIPCQSACPVHTDARGYVRAIAAGDFARAYLIARGPNPLASMCGRVCGAPCEVNCRRGKLDRPVAIRALKRFATERFGPEAKRLDEAILAVVLLALTSFHGLTMTPLWENPLEPAGTVLGWIAEATGAGYLTTFTIGMTAVLVASIILYMGFCLIAQITARRLDLDEPPGFWRIFTQFSYSVLPIALFYHVAHNGMHLFMEGQNVLTLISDPMGRGWDLFGTAKTAFPPILGKDSIWVIQVILVIVGHVYGTIVSQKTAQRLFGTGRAATIVQLPLLAVMIAFSFISLWLMHLDMNMRGTMM